MNPVPWTQEKRGFYMSKLTYEDKINIYIDKKGGMSIGSLSSKYKVSKNIINYLTALIDKHGIDILRTDKNRIHTKFFFHSRTTSLSVNYIITVFAIFFKPII